MSAIRSIQQQISVNTSLETKKHGQLADENRKQDNGYYTDIYDDLPPLLDEYSRSLTFTSQPQQSLAPSTIDQSDEEEMIVFRPDKKVEPNDKNISYPSVKEERKQRESLVSLFQSIELEEEKEDVPLEFRAWDEVSKDKIISLLADQKDLSSKLEAFKFFLGPPLDPILRRYRHELYEELSVGYFRNCCAELFYERMLAGIQIYFHFLYVARVVATRITEIQEKAIDGDLKVLGDEIKSSYEAIVQTIKQQGLEPFKAWFDKNKRSLKELSTGKIFGFSPVLFCPRDLSITDEIRDELRPILLKWVSPWMENEIQRSWCIKGLSEGFILETINYLQESSIDILLKSPNLQELEHRIRNYPFPLRKSNQNKVQLYSEKIQAIKNSYGWFAYAFLQSKQNRLLVKRFLFPLPSGSYHGMSASKLVNWIIKYKLHMPYYKNTNWTKKIMRLISDINDQAVRKQFEEEFEKHCHIILLKRAQETVVAVQQQMEANAKNESSSLFLASAAIPTEFSPASAGVRVIIDILKIATATSHNNSLLESRISNPLSEDQLLLLLDSFTSISQKQLFLKDLLKHYLSEECDHTWSSLGYSLLWYGKPLERRRQIQYLASLLYVASKTGKEDGVLSSVTDQKDAPRVGTSLVIDAIQKEQESYSPLLQAVRSHSRLTNKLQEFEAWSLKQHKTEMNSDNSEFDDKESASLKSNKAQTTASPLVRFSKVAPL